MPTSQLEDATAKFRQALAINDQAAARALIANYGQAYNKIRGDLANVTAQIEQARARGERVSPGALLRQKRYLELQRTTAQEIGKFAKFAEGEITAQQKKAAQLGAAHSQRMAQSALPRGVRINLNALPTRTVEELSGQLSDGSPLSDLLSELADDAAEGIRRALVTGVATGQGPREIARHVEDELQGNLTRALTISRTESLRAARTAALEGMRANHQALKGWVWTASATTRTCAFCWAMSGTHHKLSEDFYSHVNCRCTPTPETQSFADLGFPELDDQAATPLPTGIELFDQLSEAAQLAILGRGKFKLYQQGELDLSDLVGYTDSPVWGKTGRERSLRDILAERAS